MKVRSSILFLLLSGLILSCEEDKKAEVKGLDIGALHLQNSKPQPGEVLRFRYTPESDSAVKPETTVNFIVHGNSYPTDVDLEDSASYWTGRIKIPDSVHALAFNFMNDYRYENNDRKGYIFNLYDKEGQKLKGSDAAMGSYYIRNGLSYDLEFERDSALALMGRDLSKHPDLKEQYDSFYPNMLSGTDRDAALAYADERIAYYKKKKELSEKDLQNFASLYGLIKEKEKSDSIYELAISRYPEGDIAKNKLQSQFFKAQTPEEKKAVLTEYEDKIGKTGDQYDLMLNYLSRAYATTGNIEAFKEYSGRIFDPMTQAEVYNSVAWNMAEDGEDLETAEELSSKSVSLIRSLLNGIANKPYYYSQKQYKSSLRSSLSSYLDTYSFINYKQGDLEKAVELQKEAVSETSSSEVNERYVMYLIEIGQFGEAQKVAENFVKDNRATDKVKEYLKTAYSENNKSMADYDNYLSSLEKVAENKIREGLKKDLLNDEAPAFTLKDLEGNEVALSSLKGKTVILDFWATWCGPCINSFPGMQKAVTKYKDDPNVKFLFVDTFENTPTREKDVADFISDNDYSFHVLLDKTMGPDGNNFQVANAYNISGIPTKVIIGPDGKLKFKKVGYSGNNEQMVKELDIMIELINDNASEKDKIS